MLPLEIVFKESILNWKVLLKIVNPANMEPIL